MLTPLERRFLATTRRATLATLGADGGPRLVPICFVLSVADEGASPVLYSPLDEKPKRVTDPRQLGRVRDMLVRPQVGVLVDRWSEDWTALGWLRLTGRAVLIEAHDAVAETPGLIEDLRAKYPQYDSHDLETRPMLRIEIDGATSWGDLRGAAPTE